MPQPQAVIDAYAAKLQRIVDRGEVLDAKEAKQLVAILNRARKEVLGILSDAPTDWAMTHYGGIQTRIEKAILGNEAGLYGAAYLPFQSLKPIT